MKTGLFIQSYQIATELIGAPIFEVHLAVNTPLCTITGQGIITNASVYPQMEIYSKISGNFTYIPVMSNSDSILVNTTGYPNINFPPNTGVGPVIIPNTKLTMVMESSWQKGTANFSFTDDQGNWIDIKDAKVTAITVKEPINNH